MIADAGGALDTTHQWRAAALVNVIFLATQWKWPDTFADLLEAQDETADMSATTVD